MNLQMSPDAPALIRDSAASVLVCHIGAGCVAIVSGGAAPVLRKEGRRDRLAGQVFVVSMLVTLAIGVSVAPLLHQTNNTFGGVLGIYLVRITPEAMFYQLTNGIVLVLGC